MILVVCPNPAIDVVLHVENFRVGAVHRCSPARRRGGGKGLNVGRAIRALGGESLVIGASLAAKTVTSSGGERSTTTSFSKPSR